MEQPNNRKAFEESKDDTINAFYIADYFHIEHFLKEEKYLALKHLTRTRLQLIEQLTRPKQHFISQRSSQRPSGLYPKIRKRMFQRS